MDPKIILHMKTSQGMQLGTLSIPRNLFRDNFISNNNDEMFEFLLQLLPQKYRLLSSAPAKIRDGLRSLNRQNEDVSVEVLMGLPDSTEEVDRPQRTISPDEFQSLQTRLQREQDQHKRDVEGNLKKIKQLEVELSAETQKVNAILNNNDKLQTENSVLTTTVQQLQNDLLKKENELAISKTYEIKYRQVDEKLKKCLTALDSYRTAQGAPRETDEGDY